MKKWFFATILLFFGTIALNYLLIQWDSLSSSGMPVAITRAADNLSTIPYDFFVPSGIGRSIVTQGYGATPYDYLYADHWHDGIDIAAVYGQPIYTAAAGTVLATGNQDAYCYHRGFGKYVAVKDLRDGLILWYAHLGTIAVIPGSSVAKGTEVGTVGATGYETGVHLHFSIFNANGFSMENRNGCGPDPTGQDEDPIPFLERLAG